MKETHKSENVNGEKETKQKKSDKNVQKMLLLKKCAHTQTHVRVLRQFNVAKFNVFFSIMSLNMRRL